MRKLLILLAVAIVALASAGLASGYTQALYSSVEATVNDPSVVNTGSTISDTDSATQNYLAQDYGADMTPQADGSDIAELMLDAPSTCSGPICAMSSTKGAESLTSASSSGVNECLIGVKDSKVPIGATYHYGAFRGKVDVKCDATFGVMLTTHTCLLRFPGNMSLPWKPAKCSSHWGFMETVTTLTHACDYTTYPYQWRAEVLVTASYPGGTVSGVFHGRKVNFNCA